MNLRHERMGPHFEKWHLVDAPASMALHHFTAPDSGDPHDHPFAFISHVLSGGYVEEVYARDGTMTTVARLPGTAHRVEAEHIHRIVGLPDGECLTLAIYGPWERETRFWRWDEGGALSRLWNSDEWERTD